MRLISFSLTPDAILEQRKTVTRRTGWATLKPGTVLQPVRKAMGLKKGEHPEKLGGPIRVVSVRSEQLWNIDQADVVAEGFAGMSREVFIAFFCDTHNCAESDPVTRIEFEYIAHEDMTPKEREP